MAKRINPVTLDGFPLGLDNRSPETDLAPQALRAADNIDVHRSGTLRRRDGYTRLTTSSDTHSLYAAEGAAFALVVADGSLQRIDPDLSLTPLQTINAIAPVSYAEFNDNIYWSNGRETGRVLPGGDLAYFWGVPTPPAPEVETTAGAYDAGDYLVATTYLALDGEEGGASPVVVISVAAGERLRLVNLPTPPAGVAMTRVYVSQANGEQLYHAQDVPSGMSTTEVFADRLNQGKPLETLFMGPPPPGHIVRGYHGRLFIASGSTLWFTEALRPGLTRLASGFFQFPKRITLAEPADDGIYVASGNKTFFLAGADAADMSLRFAAPNGAIEGTGIRLPADRLPLENLPTGPRTVWWSDDGVMTVGIAEGQILRLTANRLAVPDHDAGAMFYREQNGMAQLLSVLRDSGGVNALSVSDSAVATVHKNGVVVP